MEEGLCQLVALLWVENAALHGVSRGDGGDKAGGGGMDDDARAGDGMGTSGGWEEVNLAAMAGYVANQIRTDPTEVYGDGLR